MQWLEFGLSFLFGALAGYIFARVRSHEAPQSMDIPVKQPNKITTDH